MSFIWDEKFELGDVPRKGGPLKEDQQQSNEESSGDVEREETESVSVNSLENLSVPIVTNQLDPSLWTRVARLVRNILLFPTKVTVILGILSFIWLLTCSSWVGYGLTNDHYCPADPRIPEIIAWHGIIWVGMSVYIMVRLIWVEVNPSQLPTCTWVVGNPSVVLRWRKEATYVLDCFLFAVVVVCYSVQFSLLVSLSKSDTLFYIPNSSNWPTCEDCCSRNLVAFAGSQLLISYIALVTTAIIYLYAMGLLENIRRKLCNCDVAQTAEESTRLV